MKLPAALPLTEYLAGNASVTHDLAAVIGAISKVAETLSDTISLGPLAGALGAEVGSNTDGDTQKALDVLADDLFADVLSQYPVRWYASEEREDVIELNASGTLAIAIDPLDGSSNIDLNISIGSIFSIFDAKDEALESFFRPGREQLAAGYVVYGPQTSLILATAHEVAMFVREKSSGFRLVTNRVLLPHRNTEFAINASNYRFWSRPVRAFIDDCLAGAEGPKGRDFNMRWVASLVAETHRILTRGGIFLYPSDSRKGYDRGRLRHIYECAPIAFVIEKAGGKATDGIDRILNAVPTSLHQRTPFVFGAPERVYQVASYHDLPDSEISPLFGKRGLFRA
ncbi:MAG: class 1 fructose-bisphosphatase [Pseudomonadota bacterium]